MKKKKSPRRTKAPQKKITHIHLFYVVAIVWVVGTILAYGIVTQRENEVLSAKTIIARGEGEGGRGEGNANGGKIEIGDVEKGAKLDIKARGGKVIEDESGSFDSDKKRGSQKDIIEKFRGKQERRASDSGKKKDLDIVVASESGEPIEVKKNRKEKILVLPEKAVAALLKNGIIQQIASGSGDASSAGRVVYTRTNGSPVYIVSGTKEEKLFGAIPVTLQKTVTVSAETGEVVETKKSFVTTILDLFSF